MFCRPTRDKAQLATAPQWQVVTNFVKKLKDAEATSRAAEQKSDLHTGGGAPESAREFVPSREPSTARRIPVESSAPTMRVHPAQPKQTDRTTSDVIDLPALLRGPLSVAFRQI